MKLKYLLFIIILNCISVSFAQSIEYNFGKSDKVTLSNIFGKSDKVTLSNINEAITPISLNIEHYDFYNKSITFKYTKKEGVRTETQKISLGLTNLIQTTENGFEVFVFQKPSYSQYKKNAEGLVTNQVEIIKPLPYVIVISEDKQKVYIYTRLNTEYRPLLAAHQKIDLSKSPSAKKDINLFESSFNLVNDYFEYNERLNRLAKDLIEKKLNIQSLELDEISNLYWFLKSVSVPVLERKKYGPHLIEFTKACLEIDKLGLDLKLEMHDFIELQKTRPSHLPSDYIVLNYDLDIKFNYFKNNINTISNEDVDRLVNIFEKQSYVNENFDTGEKNYKNNQIVKLSTLQIEKTKRDPSENNYTKLLDYIKQIELKELFYIFLELNYGDIKLISEKFIGNHELVLEYADLLIDRNEAQKAIDHLYQAELSPQVKMRIFRCIKQLQGVIAATDYLMAQKPQAKSWNSVISEAVSDISSQERYNLIKHLYENNKSSLDSLDFTLIFGYGYFKSGIDKNDEIIWKLYRDKLNYMDNTNPELLEEKHKFITKILKEFNYKEELKYHEDIYWKNRIILESAEFGCGYSMCFEIANKYVKQGKASKEMCSSHFYNMALSMKEGLSGRGERFTTEFEKPYREVIDLCNKSLQLDPNNALNYKLIGDCYFFMGDGNKKQYYYNLAAKNGVSMKDRIVPSGGKSGVKTGPRGGKYYVNSNGNRTYVK